MVINLIASAMLPMPAAQASQRHDVIEVCTPEGMVWIDAQGHRLHPDGQTGHSGITCQFCLPLLHGSYCAATPTALPLPSRVLLQDRVALPIVRQASARAYLPVQPRAPPAV